MNEQIKFRNFEELFEDMFNGLVVLSVNFVRLLKVQISTLDESALDVTKIYIYNGINFELRFFERKLA